MFTRIQKRAQAKGEGGFTLIELLVVIIIIAILAAIAIPMYLSQREKGWRANTQSDLRNAAVAAESFYTDDSTYAGMDDAALTDNGYNQSADVTLTVEDADATSFCLEAEHSSGGGVWHLGNRDGDAGAPEENGC